MESEQQVLIDTDAYSALLAEILAESDAVLLSPIVLGELLDGFAGGAREQENRRELRRLRAKPRTVLVPATDETAEWFTVVKQQLRRKGTPIPTNDVWIAASCMEHGASLLSSDAHFREIDGLRRVITGARNGPAAGREPVARPRDRATPTPARPPGTRRPP